MVRAIVDEYVPSITNAGRRAAAPFSARPCARPARAARAINTNIVVVVFVWPNICVGTARRSNDLNLRFPERIVAIMIRHRPRIVASILLIRASTGALAGRPRGVGAAA